MTDTKYNGWANYETWAVHLWMSKEEDVWRRWRHEAQAAVYRLAEWLKNDFETQAEMLRPGRPCDLWTDLLTSAIQQVRWEEIARALLED